MFFFFFEFLHPHKYMFLYRYIHISVTLPKLNLAPAKMVIGGKLRSFWGHLLRGKLAVIPVGGGAGGESSTRTSYIKLYMC